MIWIGSLKESLWQWKGIGIVCDLPIYKKKGKNGSVQSSKSSFTNNSLWRWCDVSPGPPSVKFCCPAAKAMSALGPIYMCFSFKLPLHSSSHSSEQPTAHDRAMWINANRSFKELVVLAQLWTTLPGHFSSRTPCEGFSPGGSWVGTLALLLSLPLLLSPPCFCSYWSQRHSLTTYLIPGMASKRTQPVTHPKSLPEDLHYLENHLLYPDMLKFIS